MYSIQQNSLERCRNIEDLRSLCQRRLPKPLFDFIDGGAEEEWTLRKNTSAFDKYCFISHALTDTAKFSSKTRVLGQIIDLPIILAPTGGTSIIRKDAELAAARSAAKFGAYYTLSNFAGVRLEKVAGVSAGPKMFQLYLTQDRKVNSGMILRAKVAGFNALCITIDSLVAGNRERDSLNGLSLNSTRIFSLPMLKGALAHPIWLWNYLIDRPDSYCNFDDDRSLRFEERQAHGRSLSQSVDWEYISSLVKEWGGPFAIKGIVSIEDSRRALEAGVTAIIVSNHGGRQLDGAIPAISALPQIVNAVGEDLEVILDGGVRRGAHVLKALALGAKACMIGRPHVYGLGAAGESGLSRAIQILSVEIERTAKLLGCLNTATIDRSYITQSLSEDPDI